MSTQLDDWRASLIADYEAAIEHLQRYREREPLIIDEMVKTLQWAVRQMKEVS